MTHKFRAWDKNEKRFLEDHQIFISGYGLKRGNHGDHMSMERQDSIVIMQSTGIKDKNGVEVFEGDVLHIYKYSEALPLDFTVEFITGCYCSKDKFGSTSPLYEDLEDDGGCEIIGNIWANPELGEGE